MLWLQYRRIYPIQDLKKSVTLLRSETDDIKEKAEKIAQYLHDKLPIIYSTDRFAPVSVRFRQQLNENAKMLSWSGVIPEMNHNELVGWRDRNNNLAVIYFRSKDDHKRNQTRIDINKDIIGNFSGEIAQFSGNPL